MGLLDIFFSKKETWDEIKKTDKVYPANSISIFMLNTVSGQPGTGWFDAGYEKYAYKKSCPYNFLIMVSLKDSIAIKNPGLDMGTIEDFFVQELRKVCIAHIVARVVTDEGLNIEMYLEQQEPAMNHLRTILENPNRLVSFNCEVTEDPEWTVIKELMSL